jgi:hypothetical protein
VDCPATRLRPYLNSEVSGRNQMDQVPGRGTPQRPMSDAELDAKVAE